ncbi:MAG TPA: alpha/beta fold hydrolase, partial [Candidatus Dormibacteraeota bacterium]|nr:alpha/beta fold hydrolase [Candidatus Dormibacteraeota bacterium]
MDLVLIHGSYFGPWCWELVIPELERLGHRAVAPDLPISEPGLGASAYADAIVSAIRTDGPPVVVAHSMAGLVAPL